MDFKNGISLCMIVKNEEQYLQSCLNSVKDYVNEICIVDTGSTDSTIQIISNFTSNSMFNGKITLGFYEKAYTNSTDLFHFAEARNQSLKLASFDKILILDADEVVVNPEVLQAQFIWIHKNKGGFVNFNNVNANFDHKSIRLFWNNYLYFYGRIHEYLMIGNTILDGVETNLNIRHFGYQPSIMTSKNKIKRNELLLKEQADARHCVCVGARE